jgi:hypothetical protein
VTARRVGPIGFPAVVDADAGEGGQDTNRLGSMFA